MNIATGVLSKDLLTIRPMKRFSMTSGKLVVVAFVVVSLLTTDHRQCPLIYMEMPQNPACQACI
ncbi:MAG: hypothetical protein L7W43_03320 [Rubripirellula sp.]|nr:hypothetical protein [Rubripirellula sp.]